MAEVNGFKTAYIGIGSNLGDRAGNCRKAVILLGEYGIKAESSSSMIESIPWGIQDQPDFINMCVKISTSLDPDRLLDALIEIEQRLGRVKTYVWGPRIIDLDILLYENDIIIDDKLRIPHEQLHRREFALRTLNEIAPDVIHPELHITIKKLLEDVTKS
jgi:2-amino-4-hydroxy-6-hydroxymethyldihydropteridine diphosphokinase